MFKKIKNKSLSYIENEKIGESINNIIDVSNKYKEKSFLLSDSNYKTKKLEVKNSYMDKNETSWGTVLLTIILFTFLFVPFVIITKEYVEIKNYVHVNGLNVEDLSEKALNNFKLSNDVKSEDVKSEREIQRDFNVYISKEFKKNDDSMNDVLKITKHQMYLVKEKDFVACYITVLMFFLLSLCFFAILLYSPVKHFIRKIIYGKEMSKELSIEKKKQDILNQEMNELESLYQNKWESTFGKEKEKIKIEDIYIEKINVEGLKFKEIVIKDVVTSNINTSLYKKVKYNQKDIEFSFQKIERDINSVLEEASAYKHK